MFIFLLPFRPHFLVLASDPPQGVLHDAVMVIRGHLSRIAVGRDRHIQGDTWMQQGCVGNRRLLGIHLRREDVGLPVLDRDDDTRRHPLE